MIEHQKQKSGFFRAIRLPSFFGGSGAARQKEITAGLIVFRKTFEGPKYLLLYHRGSYWNFPKGHVEKEEGSLEAAIRETTEETACGGAICAFSPISKPTSGFFRKEKGNDFQNRHNFSGGNARKKRQNFRRASGLRLVF